MSIHSGTEIVRHEGCGPWGPYVQKVTVTSFRPLGSGAGRSLRSSSSTAIARSSVVAATDTPAWPPCRVTEAIASSRSTTSARLHVLEAANSRSPSRPTALTRVVQPSLHTNGRPRSITRAVKTAPPSSACSREYDAAKGMCAPRRDSSPTGRRCSRRNALLERGEDVSDLLVDDRLQDPLAHRADGTGDADVGLPGHRRAAVGLGERERRRHVHHRPDAGAFRVHRRELGRPLLEPLEVHRHLEPAEAERHLHLGRPVAVVDDLEALDAGHQARHLRRIVDHVPHDLAGGGQLLGPLDLHLDSTVTVAPLPLRSISHTRWYGLWLSKTNTSCPAERTASCTAAEMQ